MKSCAFKFFIAIVLVYCQTIMAQSSFSFKCPPRLKQKVASPKIPFAYEKVSPAAITPKGRWKETLSVIADGWIGRAAQTKHPVFYSFLWERDWSKGDFASPHYAVYLAGGYVRLGNYLPGSHLSKMYHSEWLPNVLASQMSNGYIGGGQVEGTITLNLPGRENAKVPRYELLSVDLVLETLLWEYEFSGNEAALEAAIAMKDFTLNDYINPEVYIPKEMETPAHQAICRSILDIYRYTGDEKIMHALKHYVNRQKASLKSAFAKNRPHFHAVCYSYMLQAPINMYHYMGDDELLEMALEGFNNSSEFALQSSGTITGCEITLEKGCRKYSEHCAVCEWKNACVAFLRSRGDVRFADIAERCIHNAYLGSKSPDGLSVTYYHTMNQLFATDWTGQYLRDYEPSDIFNGDYNMAHSPLCCNVITSKSFAQFIENSVLKTPDGEIAFVFYGPSSFCTKLAGGKVVQIEQDTDYPYEDKVNFKVSLDSPVEFALRFRIPGFCRSAKLTVNGKNWPEKLTPGTFARIERKWKNSDKIELTFDFPITLEWDNSPAAGKGAAVVRGPLVYALPIEADWNYTGKEPPSPINMKESWNVVIKEGEVWNVALGIDPDDPRSTLKAVKLAVPKDSLPWQNPPIGLQCSARLLPNWTLDRISNNPCTPAIPKEIKPIGGTFPVTLVPFGFTQLRMTVLPVIGRTEKAETKHGQHQADI